MFSHAGVPGLLITSCSHQHFRRVMLAVPEVMNISFSGATTFAGYESLLTFVSLMQPP